ncbi:translation initiation factor IF-1 [Mycoplasmopsis synoviae]|uniref:Translation initiation factor IF-1 n=2 Tax=Mycoplasmopsis synoviae TaxID=2109 RepID=IF1_MYCS5|nr:translation initiation factor IF-1 [Mycoplasmopsis synoviae]Q4A5I6.1 RecName: Full=Translation initiation factor IF-1 [Mycoplasmopsis synoviae 53]AAZ43985.1 translation initiation factor IF-1 [Mycoplasmopsis synoviae 53]AKB11300.1 translation initiation factor IF-1 [Mycoplasmopsis synoviae ATCC 25204]AKJ20802.1 Translation initiation factor 1 [Mycoplasmopsis synoviae]AQU48125.1 Translation initiation factor 1 [Mycoplasmopsis synoviae]AWL84350.1 translation initiation factor IF-1 [Mycoplasm
MAKDAIKLRAKVLEAYSMDDYLVELENKQQIKAKISGKMRVNRIRILPGDLVDVELSSYDLTKGRITYRHK